MRNGGLAGGLVGGAASVATHGEQMRNCGRHNNGGRKVGRKNMSSEDVAARVFAMSPHLGTESAFGGKCRKLKMAQELRIPKNPALHGKSKRRRSYEAYQKLQKKNDEAGAARPRAKRRKLKN